MAKDDSPKKVDTIIFDFDGVIADSGNIFRETLEEILRRPKPFTTKEIEEMRGLSTRGIIKKLGIKKWQLPRILVKGKRGMAQRIDRVEVFKDMPQAIISLNKEGYRLYILSSNSKEAIERVLERYKLIDNILGIYSGAGLFGKAKRLRVLLKKEKLSNSQCVYIGDETRDIEAAKQADIKSIAVEWGYSAPAALKTYNPDKIVQNPADLVSAVALL